MSEAALAERYARAIFELGVEAGELDQITAQFRELAEAFAQSPDLRSIAENPVVDEPSRDGLLKELGARLNLSPLAVNSLRLIGARRRLRALPDIAAELRRLADDKAGVLRATVTSAKPLPDAYYERLAAELQKTTGRRVLFEKLEDPSLIGGVVTRVGDHTIDGSVRGRLLGLERQLLSST